MLLMKVLSKEVLSLGQTTKKCSTFIVCINFTQIRSEIWDINEFDNLVIAMLYLAFNIDL